MADDDDDDDEVPIVAIATEISNTWPGGIFFEDGTLFGPMQIVIWEVTGDLNGIFTAITETTVNLATGNGEAIGEDTPQILAVSWEHPSGAILLGTFDCDPFEVEISGFVGFVEDFECEGVSGDFDDDFEIEGTFDCSTPVPGFACTIEAVVTLDDDWDDDDDDD